MNSVVIRVAIEEDVPALQLCAQKAYLKYVERIGREPAPMRADFLEHISRGFVSVAICQSGLAGYVVAYQQGVHFMLESVAVLPEYSGKGVGKLLIMYVEKKAKTAGCETVELYTNEAMTENLSMYPKFGYCEVGRKIEHGFNRVLFSKPL